MTFRWVLVFMFSNIKFWNGLRILNGIIFYIFVNHSLCVNIVIFMLMSLSLVYLFCFFVVYFAAVKLAKPIYIDTDFQYCEVHVYIYQRWLIDRVLQQKQYGGVTGMNKPIKANDNRIHWVVFNYNWASLLHNSGYQLHCISDLYYKHNARCSSRPLLKEQYHDIRSIFVESYLSNFQWFRSRFWIV